MNKIHFFLIEAFARPVKRFTFLLLIMIFPVISFGAQTIKVKDHDTVKANISASEPTRLSVKDDRILMIRGVQGAYTYSNDNLHGAVFLQPTESYQNTPFYLFVDTEQGYHYLMELTPDRRSASMLVLVPKETEITKQVSGQETPSYSDSLTKLMKYMANNATPENYEVVTITNTKAIALSANLQIRLKTVYRGYLKGEVYEVTNLSKKPVSLTEQTFYREGDRAIRIQEYTIPAGGKTLIYKVTAHG